MRLGYSSQFWCDKMGLCNEHEENKDDDWKRLSEFVWFEDVDLPYHDPKEQNDLVEKIQFTHTPFVPIQINHNEHMEDHGRINRKNWVNERIKRSIDTTLQVLLDN